MRWPTSTNWRPMIDQHHLDMLAASGITPEFAAARGYETITEKRRLADLKITAAGRNVPGLLVPMLRDDGSTWGYQYRPDVPRLRDGKAVKYETPTGQRNGLDVPPGVADRLGNPDVPLWITEGVKKADCGAAHGLCIVALSGVWNWLFTNSAGGKMAFPEWRDCALNNNRRVIIAFDGDLARKEPVQKAARGLASYLATKGARIEYLWLPDPDDKTGLDDYLASHTVDELWRLVKPTQPPVVARDKAREQPQNLASARPAAKPVQPVSLADAVGKFQHWLPMDDPAPILVVAATVVANLADGDPVWLLIVGPPSGGKTEILSSCSTLPYIVPAATLTEAALLSGTSKRERAADATGGLMRQIGDFGILLAKDFTSVLAQNRDTAKQAMAAMREIYDGKWDRPTGADGGRVLHWHGKCGFVGGVTPSYDRYGSIVNTLGDRYLLLRLPKVDAARQARAALGQAEHEKQMRVELAEAMTGLIASADLSLVHAALTEDETAALVTLASFAATARTVVERDGYTGELLVMPQPEGPARLIKAMRRIYGALGALGVDDDTRWGLMVRIALDCAPALRVPIMRQLVGSTDLLGSTEPQRTVAIAEQTGMVTKTASRILDDLTLLGIAERSKKSEANNSPDLWAASDWLREHWPEKIEVRQISTTKRVRVIKEDSSTHENTASQTESFTAFRTSLSHSDPSTNGHAEQADRDAAYKAALCSDCKTKPHSAGRPRCDGCHATYVRVMARYDR
jgi:Domain of unknown function (DUF3854)